MLSADKNLKNCLGCLADKKTSDEVGLRRQPPERDEDAFALDFSSPYAIDATQKVILSRAFRRLGFKTQVLTAATNAHIRNRLSHTYEVTSIAAIIARILGLNENLCQAIALAHDIGHVPFGHVGEKFISKITGKNFRHEVFGVVIAQNVEREGGGLNLTRQVLEGILNHSRGANDLKRSARVSEEANAVMYADKIAYVWADIKDIFERTRLIDAKSFPELYKLISSCGKNSRERVAFCVKNLCHESAEKGFVSFKDSEAARIFSEIKDLMYDKVYKLLNPGNLKENLEKVYEFLLKTKAAKEIDPAVVLALMTDSDVLSLANKQNIDANDFQACSAAEVVNSLKYKNIDFTNPDVDW